MHFSRINIPIGRTVLGRNDTRLYDVRHQGAGGDKVSYNCAIRRDCGFVGTVVAFLGKTKSAHVPTPNIHGFINRRCIHYKQFVRIAVFIAVENNISTALTRDKVRGFLNCVAHKSGQSVNLDGSIFHGILRFGNRIQKCTFCRAERNRHILFSKGVINRSDNLCGCGHTKKSMLNRYSVTKRNSFKKSRVFRLFPQWFKGNLNRGVLNTQRIILKVGLCLLAQSLLGELFVRFKSIGEILNKGLGMHQRCFCDRQGLLT